jgi:hypothetical protein
MYVGVLLTYSTFIQPNREAQVKYLFSILLLCATMQAKTMAEMTAQNSLPDAPSHKTFWTVENKVGFGLLGGLIAADAITTQRGLSQGFREANPLMRPFVTRGAAGEAAGSAIGFGAGIGFAYLLHQTHHYKAERIAMRLMVVGESAIVASNIRAIR